MPLYLEIRDDIKRLLETGVYEQGERIPTESQLADRYGVSLPTVRRAIDQLVDEGYLTRRPRHGTVVSRRKIDQAFTGSILTYDNEMYRNGRMPRTKVIVQRAGEARGSTASLLEVPEGTRAMRLVRLRYADGVPNVFVSSLVPLDVLAGIEEVDFTKVSLYDTMRKLGQPVVHLWRHVEVVRANEESAAFLDEAVGDPMFLFQTVARAASGRVLERSRAFYRGQTNAFDFNERFVYSEFGRPTAQHEEP